MDELRIKIEDWRDIIIFGILFGLVLCGGIYLVLDQSFLDGMIFGTLNGFFIAIYSAILITFLNHEILSNTEKKFWYLLSFIFSFFSGFLGNLTAFYISVLFSLKLIPNYAENQLIFASIVGLMAYFIGFVLYKFVVVRNKNESIQTHLVKTQLELLESQLNPHFLFNSLNSTAELIHKDKEMAEVMIMKISTFLRQTLLKKTKISLKDELDFVTNYVWIENIRFNNEIKLFVENRLDSSSYFLPKFSIQLLVENAIKHNKKSGIDLEINIIISKDINNHLVIDVIDSGDGFDEIKFGVGLKNLKARLSILHKGVFVYSRFHNKTIFSIILKDDYENSDY